MQSPRTRLTLLALLAAAGFAGSAAAHDAQDCFPTCTEEVAPQPAPIDLCRLEVVREGVELEKKTRPIREIVHAVQNPAGYALQQVSEHVVHVPPWVPYVVDPKGAVRAKVIEVLRTEAKKSLGLHHDCEPAPAAPADHSAMT